MKNIKKSIQQGFTLIELLVVIAIIGILSGILFVAIDPGAKIDDANKAQVQASLQGVTTAAVLYYSDEDFTYLGFCEGTDIKNMGDDYKCGNTPTEWAVKSTYSDGGGPIYLCIDSTGSGVIEYKENIEVGDTTTVCPPDGRQE